jgi:hypothetical protein
MRPLWPGFFPLLVALLALACKRDPAPAPSQASPALPGTPAAPALTLVAQLPSDARFVTAPGQVHLRAGPHLYRIDAAGVHPTPLPPHDTPTAGPPAIRRVPVDGEPGSRRVLVERRDARGVIVREELPESEEPLAGELGLVARSPEDAYVFSISHGSYLVRREGTGWIREKVLNNLVTHSMLVTEEGTYYLATEGPLFRKARGERSWSEIPLPQCGEVLAMTMVDGKLWAIGKQHGADLSLFGPPGSKPQQLAATTTTAPSPSGP